jgi:murein DD-endopeptidase MepM/ murein hydrolase activator NlpD
LLRTPIDGARLSSGFGMRLHPIAGYSRMHQGSDFAAPSGTPIKAAGDGVIESAGRNGGYGIYIRIRHNSEYKTAYAHMSGIASGIRVGTRVRQGQTIGYVGSTGASTGPHLHYEVLVNNAQVNPMSLKLPAGRKLGGGELAVFTETRIRLDAEWARTPDFAGVLAAAD